MALNTENLEGRIAAQQRIKQLEAERDDYALNYESKLLPAGGIEATIATLIAEERERNVRDVLAATEPGEKAPASHFAAAIRRQGEK